jgi:hypothetical protein
MHEGRAPRLGGSMASGGRQKAPLADLPAKTMQTTGSTELRYLEVDEEPFEEGGRKALMRSRSESPDGATWFLWQLGRQVLSQLHASRDPERSSRRALGGKGRRGPCHGPGGLGSHQFQWWVCSPATPLRKNQDTFLWKQLACQLHGGGSLDHHSLGRLMCGKTSFRVELIIGARSLPLAED